MAHQLNSVTFENSSPSPHLLITGGVHGDEFEPVAAIRKLATLLSSGDPSVQSFRGRLTLVPVVNENAFLRGHRCADDGRDLARTCPGNPDGSVTEQTAWALSQLIRSADYYIDLHTGGTELAVYPLSGYCLHADRTVLDVQRRMARAFNLPVIWGTDPNLQGRSLSVARDAGVPAIYCEYLGSATCASSGVEAYITGCLNVMAELKMLDRPRPENLIRHVVENPAPQSGHMQVCNPAPLTGYFEPSVSLGDHVQPGDPLGTVYGLKDYGPADDGLMKAGLTDSSLTNGKGTVIRSTQTGIVLVLRTFPRVIAGDSVGVILDLQS